ncbi:MAG: aminoacyl-tRNA hydrolase [Betaproteobacteria bacterium]|nr:MAG: aminoacyl-tRNA hydrolase [Betaproteobacteria bacterium]
MPIKLIVGLGNPGKKYDNTRHNAGFWLVERLAAQHRITLRKDAKFHALAGRLDNASGPAWLLLPQTWMNESGTAVAALAQFHKIAADEILVAHDELDLPPGGVKIKQGGGHAGHNGLRDIIAKLGTTDFWRLRIGIGHPRDVAATEQEVADFVLHPPRKEELALIEAVIDRGIAAFDLILEDKMAAAMHKLHTKPKPPASEASNPAT